MTKNNAVSELIIALKCGKLYVQLPKNDILLGINNRNATAIGIITETTVISLVRLLFIA
tara:strand:+ start:594 stop:770 length:177 start_codon:yes stop_codon:yes gene_type:complete